MLLHEEIQRNATPFDDAGIPEGEYEFPFSFSYVAILLSPGFLISQSPQSSALWPVRSAHGKSFPIETHPSEECGIVFVRKLKFPFLEVYHTSGVLAFPVSAFHNIPRFTSEHSSQIQSPASPLSTLTGSPAHCCRA